jgi:L-threonylcarbamoyladenylate synthase
MVVISNTTSDEITRAANALVSGHLVAFPTETVYGLGADANNEKAVSRIYSVKGRPVGHPLIVHISSIEQFKIWAENIPDYAVKLSLEFWPGPMTLIVKRSLLAKNYVTGGQETVGLRIPAHPIAQELLASFEKLGGFGVAAPSANRFGAVSPTNLLSVVEELENFLCDKDVILNGGQCKVGIESTIIDCTSEVPKILRPGSITPSMIENKLGIKVSNNLNSKTINTSGQLNFHYSPAADVVLNVIAEPGDGLLAMDHVQTPKGVIRLASPKSIDQYAQQLYEALRSTDRRGLNRIVVISPEGEGLAQAIRDRLGKSSASRTGKSVH